MFKQNLLFCIHVHVHSLGDDQCVDVMNKKLIMDVFRAPHLFLSCCTASLVKVHLTPRFFFRPR